MNASRISSALLPVSLTFAAVLLSGCGVANQSTAANAGTALSGRLFGGQQAVVGAKVQLYAAGTAGLGSAATSLLTQTVVTDSNGGFSITGDYTCPSASTQVYLLARGGNPGLAGNVNNTALVMMAALGNCANLTPSSFVTVNEVTTAAAAWALAQFSGGAGNFGATATNTTGLANAFLVANNLVNTSTGLAGGAGLPTGATLEQAKLYTLADALAVCVNSDGGTGCNPLFAAAIENGVTPANTLDAALSIVRNPGRNVAAVFNSASAQGPFQPVLGSTPNDWTMTLDYTGALLYAPTALGIDSTGAVWAADYYGGHVSKLAANGVAISSNVANAPATAYTDPHLYESYGLAIDGQDNAWITVEETAGSINSGYGSITEFSSNGTLLSGSGYTAGGIYFPYDVAADSNGTVWVADYGDSHATLLASDGTSLSGASGYQPSGLTFPTAVALDNTHTAWFGVQGSVVAVQPSGASVLHACCQAPAGVTLDPQASVWVADYSASAVVRLTASGTPVQTLQSGGLYKPESILADGSGNIWVTNYRGNTITGYTAVTASNPVSQAISPSTGFGVDAMLDEPFGIAVDAAGNVWVSNFASNSLTQFVGLAAPTRTPRLGLATTP